MLRYEVNIARKLDGQKLYFHWARVTLGATIEKAAIAQAQRIKESFPEPEWEVSLTQWDNLGRNIKI